MALRRRREESGPSRSPRPFLGLVLLCVTCAAPVVRGFVGPAQAPPSRVLGLAARGSRARVGEGARAVGVGPTPLASVASGGMPEATAAGATGGNNRRKKPIAASIVSWVAHKIITRSTRMVAGLAVEVGARSNGDVLAGNLPKVKARFDQVFLESLQITGGGNMEITGLNIKLLTLLIARRLNVIRKPFEIFGEYVLTQQDVSNSKLIRDLIQALVNTVLRALFPSLHLTFFDVAVDSVRITNHKLAIHGTANIAESAGGMPFVLLTGVGLAGEGHVIYLDKPELILNPEAKLPVKVPLGSIRAFDVDIGDNARIEEIVIDDDVGVTIKARTLITPAPPFQVSDVGKRAAFLYDLGAFLSSFWGFTQLAEYQVDA